MTSLIDSLNRLNRAGSEHSRATAKLVEAASEVANAICDTTPPGIELPRGYVVRRLNSNVGSETFLVAQFVQTADGEYENAYVNGTGGYLHGDFNCPVSAPTREVALAFAKDIATGLMDEIAALIETRTTEADQAAATLA